LRKNSPAIRGIASLELLDRLFKPAPLFMPPSLKARPRRSVGGVSLMMAKARHL